MGFGDERGNIDTTYSDVSGMIAEALYPDAAIVPGGEDARPQRELDKSAVEKQGAVLLRFLNQQGLIDMNKISQSLSAK